MLWSLISEESLVLFIIGVLSFDVLLLAVMVFFGSVLFRYVFASRDEAVRKRKDAAETAILMHENARKEAHSIVMKAHEEASLLLKDVKSADSHLRGELGDAVRSLVDDERARFSGATDEFKRHYTKSLEDAGDMLKRTMEEFSRALRVSRESMEKSFRDSLEEELGHKKNAHDNEVKQLIAHAKQEVDAYKESAMKRIEISLPHVLFSVSRRVLGKAINLEDHEELVLAALKEAKREGFFN